MRVFTEEIKVSFNDSEVYTILAALRKYMFSDETLDHCKRHDGVETFNKNNVYGIEIHEKLCALLGDVSSHDFFINEFIDKLNKEG
jgi:hypothetical protein